MIPLKDTIPSRHWPVMTWLLLLINLAVFLFQKSFTLPEQAALIGYWGLIPGRFYKLALQNTWVITPFLSYMFLHGSWFHLLSNLWALWLFGDNVEDRMGAFRFLLFYIFTGVIAGLIHAISNPVSPAPMIGASGAIAGVMGAYFIMYPQSKIKTLIPLFFIPLFVDIPALLYLGFWLVSQIYSAMNAQYSGNETNIAWWAHIGGFVSGFLLHPLFLRRYRNKY